MMDSLIEETIKRYYGCAAVYENFSGLIYARMLNEMFHVSDMFNDAIIDICANIKKYTFEYTYTGWNIANKQCAKYNDVEEGHPIYIKRINDPTIMDALSIQDRSYSDKDTLAIFNSLIYYSSRSEQDAHINATIPYLKDHKIIRQEGLSDKMIDIIEETRQFNGFPQYSKYIEILESWWANKGAYLNNIYVLGYFYKKYSGGVKAKHIKISNLDIFNLHDMDIQEKEKSVEISLIC